MNSHTFAAYILLNIHTHTHTQPHILSVRGHHKRCFRFFTVRMFTLLLNSWLGVLYTTKFEASLTSINQNIEYVVLLIDI